MAISCLGSLYQEKVFSPFFPYPSCFFLWSEIVFYARLSDGVVAFLRSWDCAFVVIYEILRFLF